MEKGRIRRGLRCRVGRRVGRKIEFAEFAVVELPVVIRWWCAGFEGNERLFAWKEKERVEKYEVEPHGD